MTIKIVYVLLVKKTEEVKILNLQNLNNFTQGCYFTKVRGRLMDDNFPNSDCRDIFIGLCNTCLVSIK